MIAPSPAPAPAPAPIPARVLVPKQDSLRCFLALALVRKATPLSLRRIRGVLLLALVVMPLLLPALVVVI